MPPALFLQNKSTALNLCISSLITQASWSSKASWKLQTLPDFLCGSSPAPSSSRSLSRNRPYPVICMQWTEFLLGYTRHWSMEMGRVSQGFLSLCKLGLPSALCPFHLWAYVWRRWEQVWVKGKGCANTTAPHHHWRFPPTHPVGLHVHWVEGGVACHSSDKRKSFENKRKKCLQLPRGKRLEY